MVVDRGCLVGGASGGGCRGRGKRVVGLGGCDGGGELGGVEEEGGQGYGGSEDEFSLLLVREKKIGVPFWHGVLLGLR